MPKQFDVEIEGVSPYLMNRFNEQEADTKTTRKAGRKDYKLEAETKLYREESGTIFVPSAQIEGAIVKAASDFQITGRGRRTYKELAKSVILVQPEAIAITPQAWVSDARPVRVQNARVMRYRPRWDKWKLRFQVLVLDDQFSGDVLKQILDSAGSYKGIGDYRPKFGRFIVTLFKQR